MANTSSARSGPFPETMWAINGGRRPAWHRSAPRTVRLAFASGDQAGAWDAWKRHLARRKQPIDPARLLPVKGGATSWALPDGFDGRPGPEWLWRAQRLLQRRQPPEPALEKELLGWLGEASGSTEIGFALEYLACSHALPRLAALLSPEVWFTLLDQLLVAVAEAGGINLQDDPLAHQLLAGELALTLAYLLPGIAACRELKPSARRALSSGLLDLLDGEGLPHARHLALLRPLLACWTRCCAIGQQLKAGCWTDSADGQYQWLVRHALRLTRPDGSHVFSNGAAGDRRGGLLEASLQFGGDRQDEQIAAAVLPGRNRGGRKQLRRLALPAAATHSEWASVAVLRPQWSRSGPRLTVLYDGRVLRTELGCGKDVLWSGPWELEVCLDGRAATPASDWEQLCWESDEDADYLELEIDLGGGLRVQRQMLMARQDGFLLLADAVLGKRPGRLEYRGRLPLRPGIRFQQAGQTLDGLLIGSGAASQGRWRASVLPLALPEWQADRRIGELAQTDRGLQLCQSSRGRNLYAPLFFDLDRRRRHRPLTWRRLTVAQSMVVQPPDVAVGYRVAVGTRQWLVYRSLGRRANRTLLGHNLSTEMLVARFDSSGKVEPVIEIE